MRCAAVVLSLSLPVDAVAIEGVALSHIVWPCGSIGWHLSVSAPTQNTHPTGNVSVTVGSCQFPQKRIEIKSA